METAVRHVLKSLCGHALRTETDRSLLDSFAERNDEQAFGELVRRHGSFVLGTCRRVLGNAADAEDAFQATFLVLARKAASIRWSGSIKSWLHGVACRVAMKARGQVLRRRQKETEAGSTREPVQSPAESWNDVRPILDAELEQLPAKCRAVLLLCYLEGKTADEAAAELGWSVGSVKGHLQRGRERLRNRLGRRGLTLSAVLVTGLIAEPTLESAALAMATTQSALSFAAESASSAFLTEPVLSLAQGALQAMTIAKVKWVGLVAAVLLLAGASASWGIYRAAAGEPRVLPGAENGRSIEPVPLARIQDAQDQSAAVPNDEVPEVAAADQEGRRNPKAEKKDEIAGSVLAIDLKAGTLKMKFSGDGQSGDWTYKLADPNLKVTTTLGLAAKLSDLSVGARVHIQVSDKDVVTALRAEHRHDPMTPAGIDPDKKTLTVREEKGDLVFNVPDDAKITVNGKAGKLAEVPLNQRCWVTLALDGKSILVLTSGRGPGEGKKKGSVREQKLTGQVSKIEGNALTLTSRGEGGDQADVYTVTKDTKIRIETDQDETVKVKGENGERTLTRPKIADAGISALKVGQQLNITFAGSKQLTDMLILRSPQERKVGAPK
jgi:RNA polymerase sigma factor (sigma-70 family)